MANLKADPITGHLLYDSLGGTNHLVDECFANDGCSTTFTFTRTTSGFANGGNQTKAYTRVNPHRWNGPLVTDIIMKPPAYRNSSGGGGPFIERPSALVTFEGVSLVIYGVLQAYDYTDEGTPQADRYFYGVFDPVTGRYNGYSYTGERHLADTPQVTLTLPVAAYMYLKNVSGNVRWYLFKVVAGTEAEWGSNVPRPTFTSGASSNGGTSGNFEVQVHPAPDEWFMLFDGSATDDLMVPSVWASPRTFPNESPFDGRYKEFAGNRFTELWKPCADQTRHDFIESPPGTYTAVSGFPKNDYLSKLIRVNWTTANMTCTPQTPAGPPYV